MAEEIITLQAKSEAELAAEQEKEKKLFGKARARASFKIHLIIFILVNALLWVIWYFIAKAPEGEVDKFLHATLFISIAWFIFLLGHYVFVYVFNATIVEKELKKLKKEMAEQEQELQKLKTIADQKKAQVLRKQQENTEN